MAVVLLTKKITVDELNLVRQEYDSYVKFVVDIEREVLGAGGEWHADAEMVLLDQGSRQGDLWGGGIDLETGVIDFVSLINTRPNFSSSQEVVDVEVRKKMEELARRIFCI
jgi:hypothetical protein